MPHVRRRLGSFAEHTYYHIHIHVRGRKCFGKRRSFPSSTGGDSGRRLPAGGWLRMLMATMR